MERNEGDFMKVAIDLTWVKPNKSGGIESFVRNLLDGISLYGDSNDLFILLLSSNNYESFNHYDECPFFELMKIDLNSEDILHRIIWLNTRFYKLTCSLNIDLCYFPTYSMPLYKKKSVVTVTTIHDLQAKHFPQYFSKYRSKWLDYSWKRCTVVADKIVAISDYVKNDIIKTYNCNPSKVVRIYNPIISSENSEVLDKSFTSIQAKIDIEKYKYFYTVSSLLPHKNLMTIIQLMQNYNFDGIKLVISGVGGSQKEELKNYLVENELNDKVIFTGFVSNDERDSLFENCLLFLLPSTFEGFGMPVVEAMMHGRNVVTTNSTSLPEVTNHLATYVNNPFDINEWYEKINLALKKESEYIQFEEYDLKKITCLYLELFYQIYEKRNMS